MGPIVLCDMLTYLIGGTLIAFFLISVACGLSVWHPMPFMRKRHW